MPFGHVCFCLAGGYCCAAIYGVLCGFRLCHNGIYTRQIDVTSLSSPLSPLATRYAGALLDLAREEETLDEVAAAMDKLAAALDKSADLRFFAGNPVVSRSARIKALEAVMAHLDISGPVSRFVLLVAHNGRLSALPEMIDAFRVLLFAHRGKVRAHVVSARPLGAGICDKLRDALSGDGGRDVELDTQVDATLIGGLVVRIGNQMIDTSIRTRLENMRIVIEGAG